MQASDEVSALLETLPPDAICATEKYFVQENPLKLIDGKYLKIKTKKMELINATPNLPQRRFLQLLHKLLATNQPVWIVIVKSRQWGGSTVSEMVGYCTISQRPNVTGLVIADDVDGSNYILEMSKLMHQEFSVQFPHLAATVERSNRKELLFEGLRSKLFIQTAQNIAAGQKYTIQFLHASEVSKYPNPRELFSGLLPAVAKVPGSIKIFESTSNGSGDYWHELAKQSEENLHRLWPDFEDYDGEPILFFVPPWEDADCWRGFRSEEAKQEFADSLNDVEKRYLETTYETIDGPKYIQLEQLHWRRKTIENDYHGDEDQFNQYYPATLDMSFIVSGRPVFNAHRLQEMYAHASSQTPQVGELHFPTQAEIIQLQIGKNRTLFEENPRGDWKIWEFPGSRGEDYTISVDTAGGEEIEGLPEGKKGDYSVIEVFKRSDKLEQVAEYRSRIDPDLLAEEVYKVWHAYLKPTIFLEVNNHGRTTADHLKHRAMVYHREVMDEQSRKITKKLGWYTDRNNKKQMIDTLAEAIRDGWVVIRSTVMVSECQSYVRASDGTTNAQSGCFDDTVMAAALGVQSHLRTPKKSQLKVVRTINRAVR